MALNRILSLIIVLSLTTGFNTQYSKRVVDRLSLLERRVSSEINFQRHDIAIIIQRLDELDKQSTKSMDGQDKTDTAIEMKADLSEVKLIDLENGINELKQDILLLYRAFGSEKKLNVEMRDTIQSAREVKKEDEDLVRAIDLKLLRQSLEQEMSSSNDMEQVNSKIDDLQSALAKFSDYVDEKHDRLFTSCKDALDKGYERSGVYDIIIQSESVQVYCDQDTDGGGWVVFQRRIDGSEDFYRGWEDYKIGFGNLEAEYWLGNDYLNAMTASGEHELRIDMEDVDGNTAYAQYEMFRVNAESKNYSLEIAGYNGNASDSLIKYHNLRKFTTKDNDNDKSSKHNCAIAYTGAWWYSSCHDSNLNGHYYKTGISPKGQGINWFYWTSSNTQSLTFVEMKLR